MSERMKFPKCPDCSCEHKEKCVQYDDIEDTVRELKERIEGLRLMVGKPEKESYTADEVREIILQETDEIIESTKETVDDVFGEVELKK